jgi:hypothetical protein
MIASNSKVLNARKMVNRLTLGNERIFWMVLQSSKEERNPYPGFSINTRVNTNDWAEGYETSFSLPQNIF